MKKIFYYICITPLAILIAPFMLILYLVDIAIEDDYYIRVSNYLLDKPIQRFKSWAFGDFWGNK